MDWFTRWWLEMWQFGRVASQTPTSSSSEVNAYGVSCAFWVISFKFITGKEANGYFSFLHYCLCADEYGPSVFNHWTNICVNGRSCLPVPLLHVRSLQPSDWSEPNLEGSLGPGTPVLFQNTLILSWLQVLQGLSLRTRLLLSPPYFMPTVSLAKILFYFPTP